jgi:hypothetical protein
MANDGRLADFLMWLAESQDRLDEYNKSTARAETMMKDHGLSEPAREALLNRDPTAIHRVLNDEGQGAQGFIVPFGPIRTGIVPEPYWGDLPLPIRFFDCTPHEPGTATTYGAALPMRAGRTAGRKRPAARKRKAAAKRGGAAKKQARRGKKTSRKK